MPERVHSRRAYLDDIMLLSFPNSLQSQLLQAQVRFCPSRGLNGVPHTHKCSCRCSALTQDAPYLEKRGLTEDHVKVRSLGRVLAQQPRCPHRKGNLAPPASTGRSDKAWSSVAPRTHRSPERRPEQTLLSTRGEPGHVQTRPPGWGP